VAASVIFLALPPFLYVFAFLLSDFIRIFDKVGWESRPFIYLQIETIFIYLIYTFSSLLFALNFLKKNNSHLTKTGIMAICMSLLFFWLGILLNIIGATTQH